MRRIWDIFPYFNEAMMADIRLRSCPADFTVVIEGNRTFSGIPKGFDFPFKDRVKYVSVSEWPETNSPWVIEEFQENSALAAIKDEIRDDDIVVCSDADEMPKWSTILKLRDTLNYSMPAVRLRMTHHKFFFNRIEKGTDWPHAGVATGACFKNRNFTGIRRWDRSPIIEDGGFHFYGMGTDKDFERKIRATSHFCEPATKDLICKLEAGWSLIEDQKASLTDYDILNLPPAVKLYPQFLA